MINNTAASCACWRGHILQKLYSKCWGARRGVHGHCKPTPSRPLCSFHPHQPAAPPADESARLTLFAGTHLVRSRAFSFVIKNKCGKCSPSHTGDAKHPAGLQRDPDKLRQVGESSEATSAKMTFQNKSERVVPLRFEVFDVEIYVTLHNVYAYTFFNKSNICLGCHMITLRREKTAPCVLKLHSNWPCITFPIWKPRL